MKSGIKTEYCRRILPRLKDNVEKPEHRHLDPVHKGKRRAVVHARQLGRRVRARVGRLTETLGGRLTIQGVRASRHQRTQLVSGMEQSSL